MNQIHVGSIDDHGSSSPATIQEPKLLQTVALGVSLISSADGDVFFHPGEAVPII